MLILATLVLQGLSLTPLIRALDLEQDEGRGSPIEDTWCLAMARGFMLKRPKVYVDRTRNGNEIPQARP